MRFGRRTKNWAAAGKRLFGDRTPANGTALAMEERNALLATGEDKDMASLQDEPAVAMVDPTQQLLTALGRFQRHLAHAENGESPEVWCDGCIDQLIKGIEIAIREGWEDIQEALTDSARILQSYEEGGRAQDSVTFLKDSYEILCLMVGDLIVDNVRSGVKKKWRERYDRAVSELMAVGLSLIEDDDAALDAEGDDWSVGEVDSDVTSPGEDLDNLGAEVYVSDDQCSDMDDGETSQPQLDERLSDNPIDEPAPDEAYTESQDWQSLDDSSESSASEDEQGAPQQEFVQEVEQESELIDAPAPAWDWPAPADEQWDEQPATDLETESSVDDASAEEVDEWSPATPASADEAQNGDLFSLLEAETVVEPESGVADNDVETEAWPSEESASAQGEIMEGDEYVLPSLEEESINRQILETSAPLKEEPFVNEDAERATDTDAPTAPPAIAPLSVSPAAAMEEELFELDAPEATEDSEPPSESERLLIATREAMSRGDAAAAKRLALEFAAYMAGLEVAKAHETLERAEARLSENGHAIESAERMVMSAGENVQAAETRTQARQLECEEKRGELDALRGGIMALDERVAEIEAAIRELQAEREAEISKREIEEEKLQEGMNEESRLRAELDELSQLEDEERDALRSAQDNVARLKAERDSVLQEIARARREVAQRQHSQNEIGRTLGTQDLSVAV